MCALVRKTLSDKARMNFNPIMRFCVGVMKSIVHGGPQQWNVFKSL